MSKEIIEKEENPPKLVSLKDFIEDYQKTIAVIGVFIVLGLFWKNIYAKESTPYISYLCFLITIPLLYEVWNGYDYHKSSRNLIVFISLFSSIFFFTAIHLLTDYPNHLATLISSLAWVGMIIILVALTDRIGDWVKNRQYLSAVTYSDKTYKREDLTQETKNEIVTNKNETLQGYYSLVGSFQKVALIWIFIIATIFYYYLNDFLQGVVYLNKEVPQISIPVD